MTEIVLQNREFLEATNCWFGVGEKACVSLGSGFLFGPADFITVLALFIAVYQLRNPKWEIRGAIRSRHLLVAGIFLGLGTASMFLSLIGPNFPPNTKIFYYVTLFQFTSFLSLVIAIAIYFFVGTSKRNFSVSRSHKYFEALYDCLAENDERKIGDILAILENDLDRIFWAFKKRKDNDVVYWLFNTLLADSQIIKFVCEKRLNFLHKVLQKIKKHGLGRAEVGNFVENVFVELLENKNSHLYRLYKRGGLRDGYDLYSVFCDDDYFHNSFEIFTSFNFFGMNLLEEQDIRVLEVQMEVLSARLKSIIKEPGGSQEIYFDRFALIFTQTSGLSMFTSSLAMNYAKYKNTDPAKAASYFQKLDKIRLFLDFSFPGHFSGDAIADDVKKPLAELEHGQYFPKNVAALYAECILDYLGAMSYIQEAEDEWRVRNSVFRLVFNIFSGRTSDYELKEYLLNGLIHRSKENVENGYYPAITRVALLICMQPWESDQRQRYVDYVYDQLPSRIIAGEKMADGSKKEDVLVPHNVHFDKAEQKFYWFDVSANPVEVTRSSRD